MDWQPNWAADGVAGGLDGQTVREIAAGRIAGDGGGGGAGIDERHEREDSKSVLVMLVLFGSNVQTFGVHPPDSLSLCSSMSAF